MQKRPLRIALLGDTVVANLPRLQAKADFPFVVTGVPDAAPVAARDAAICGADAIVATAFAHPATHATALRLVQVQGAGWERIDLACLPASTTVCNAFGHERAAAEYALMTMLMWTHRWREVEGDFRRGSWRWGSTVGGPLRNELGGKTVGIVGLGRMGREIARRTAAMGVRVLGCSRSRPEALDGLDRWYPWDELDACIGQCDFVILCVAQTPETVGLFDAARIARMRRDAVLMNLARGPIVHEEALFDALVQRTIAGAVIDVWWRYPDATAPDRRGSAMPFHELRNVMVTPHSSQWTEQMMDRRWDMVVANLRRLHAGEPLRDVVRPGAAAAH